MFTKKTYRTLIILLFISIEILYASNPSISFIENKGQWNPAVEYQIPLTFGEINLEKNRFAFLFYHYTDHQHLEEDSHEDHHFEGLYGHYFEMNFINASTKEIKAFDKNESLYYNYLQANQQIDAVNSFQGVVYEEIYPSINLKVYSEGEHFKYDFILQPNANPKNILIEYNGVDHIQINNKGHLSYATSFADIVELKPIAYQHINDERIEIECRFSLENNQVQFEFPNGYNSQFELIIDPVLIFSRLTESTNSNFGFTATYDDIGRAYGGGLVFNSGGNYPTTFGAFDTLFNGGSIDIGISCYHETTGALIYGTYIGGTENEIPNSMIVDQNGDLLVLGTTSSSDFPLSSTQSAFDSTFAGGDSAVYTSNGVYFYSGCDIVLFKLSNNGSQLLASTYLGGTENDGLNDDNNYQLAYDSTDLIFNYGDVFRGEIIVDSANNVYITSSSNSADFPIINSSDTLSGIQDAILVKFNAQLDSIIYSRFIGGSDDDGGYSMKLDEIGNIYLVGGTKSNDFPAILNGTTQSYNGGDSDGFICQFDQQNGNLLNSIYVGTDDYDQVFLIDVDLNNDVYVMGQSMGAYPVQNANYIDSNTNHFIHKFTNNLSQTDYATTFGYDTSVIEISPTALLVDICERVFVSGWGGFTNYFRNQDNTSFQLNNLPTTSGAIQPNYNGFGDFYFFILDKNTANLEYATFFGGTAQEHVDGGTSRFDENGIIYQAVCAACSGGSYYSTGTYANTASTQCNLGILKFDLELPSTNVDVDASPRATGCVPLTVNFEGTYENVSSFQWDFGDGTTSTLSNPIHTYNQVGSYTITLIGVDSNSCNLADTATLDVLVEDDSLDANFSNNININCNNRSVDVFLNSYPTTNFTWNMGDGTIYSTDSITHQYSSAGIYTISLFLEDSNSCELADTFSMDIEILPIIDADISLSDTFACSPISIDFLTNYINYDSLYWNFGNGQQLSNQNNATIVYNNPGNYPITLIVIDSNACNFGDTANASTQIVNDSIIAQIDLDSVYFDCDTMQIIAQSLNSNADEYHWNFGNGQTSTTQNANSFYGPGNYTISYYVVDSSFYCYPSDTIESTITLSPKLIGELNADTLGCAPFTPNFTANSNLSTSTFLWDFDNGDSSTDPQPNYSYQNAGNYVVELIISDTNSCNLFDTLTINITVLDDSIEAQIQLDSLYYDCDSMQFTATSLNVNPNSILWNFGNGSSSSSNPATTIYTTGTYNFSYVVIDSNFYCSPTDTIELTIELPEKLVSSFEADSFGCIPFDAQFSAQANTPTANFYWDFGDGNDSTGAVVSNTYTTVGMFNGTLSVVDSSTCNIVNDYNFTVQTEVGQVYIDIDYQTNTPSCDSMEVILQSFYTGGIHQWDMGNGDTIFGTNVSYSYTNYGDYQIIYTITDSTKDCLPQDTAHINVSFYEVETAIDVDVNNGCIPLTVNFNNVSGNAINYIWDNGNGQTGTQIPIPSIIYSNVGQYTFTLVGIDSNACNFSDTVTHIIQTNNDSVEASFELDIIEDCDSNLVVWVNNTSLNGANYSWTYNNSNSNQFNIDTIQFTTVGTYEIQLIVENQNICNPIDTFSQEVELLPNVTANFIAPNACENAIITPINLGNENLTYEWSSGAGEFSQTFIPSFNYPIYGNYTISLIAFDSTTCNLSDTAFQNIEIYSYPTSAFTTDSIYWYGDEVYFNNTSYNYTDFIWEFGDGQLDSMTVFPTHIYDGFYAFTPCLTTWNGDCPDTLCQDIYIDFDPLLGVPNAFSPNQDQTNDRLYVEGEGIEELSFKIYNRWGELIFESFDKAVGWDGTYKGVKQEMDVYTYVVSAIFIDGTSKVLKGNVTLLR